MTASSNNPRPRLSELEFLFVVGKGGVGKTTVSAALALGLASRGKRVLLAMCNANERLSHLLQCDPIGPQIATVASGIDAVNMTPESALKEYGKMVLPVASLYSAVFENRFIASFLRGIPGLEAWSMLGKAYFHTTEEGADKRKKYDTVIVDAPATGHALDMLRVPQVLTDVAPPGLLRREAEAAMHLFRDKTRAGAVIVTLLEDMPVNETIELHHALTQELRIPVHSLVANGVRPSLFRKAERAFLTRMGNEPSAVPAALESLIEAGYRRSIREGIQEEAMRRLQDTIPLTPIHLPLLPSAGFQRQAIERLSQPFAGADTA